MKVAVFGAAGSMGTRVTNTLNDDPDYWVLYIKPGDAGQARLREESNPPPRERPLDPPRPERLSG